jgi:hypothetical protein
MKILYIGDSHIFHLFPNEDNVIYLVDITLNKIRKGNGDTKIKHESYDKNINAIKYIISEDGSSLLDFINNFECDYVFLSIGEIDVRYHLSKQLIKNENALDDIYEVYLKFLNSINKNLIISSITPPGDTSNNINSRVEITKKSNEIIKKICKNNNYIYFDVYDDFNNNGILSLDKSDGGVHINKSFLNYFHEKIKNKKLCSN